MLIWQSSFANTVHFFEDPSIYLVSPVIMSSHPSFRKDQHLLKGIQNPGKNDVLFGRGGAINSHVGNIMFRKIVDEQRPFYFAASKSDKPLVALRVVEIVRKLDPPGRFLAPMRDSERNLVKGDGVLWYDVGNKKARAKASQCLRERKMGDTSFHDDDCVSDDKPCLNSNVPSFRTFHSSSKPYAFTEGLVPESPIQTCLDSDLLHNVMRSHRNEDSLMFDYSPMSTAYLKQNILHSGTPALMTYQDHILPTVSKGDETGLNIGQDSNLIDPLHFFELDCRAANVTWSKRWLPQEEGDPETTPTQDYNFADPLLMPPSKVGFTKVNSSWVPSFHSVDSCDLDVSNNTFSITVGPRKKEKTNNSFPSLVSSFPLKSDISDSVSELTDTSITDDFFA